MLRIIDIPTQQRLHQLRPFVRALVRKELRQRFRLRKQTDQIEMHPTSKSPIVQRLRRRLFVARQISIEDAVHRIAPTVNCRWQLHQTRLEWRFVALLLEGKTLLPCQAFINPLLEKCDLLRRQSLALRRHLRVGVMRGDGLDELALRALVDLDDHTILASLQQRRPVVHREPALLLVPRMTLRAMLPDERHDLMREIHCRSTEARAEGEEENDGLHEGRFLALKETLANEVRPLDLLRSSSQQAAASPRSGGILPPSKHQHTESSIVQRSAPPEACKRSAFCARHFCALASADVSSIRASLACGTPRARSLRLAVPWAILGLTVGAHEIWKPTEWMSMTCPVPLASDAAQRVPTGIRRTPPSQVAFT